MQARGRASAACAAQHRTRAGRQGDTARSVLLDATLAAGVVVHGVEVHGIKGAPCRSRPARSPTRGARPTRRTQGPSAARRALGRRRGAPIEAPDPSPISSANSARLDRARHRLLADPGCGWQKRPKVRIAPRRSNAIERAGVEGSRGGDLPRARGLVTALDTDFWPTRGGRAAGRLVLARAAGEARRRGGDLSRRSRPDRAQRRISRRPRAARPRARAGRQGDAARSAPACSPRSCCSPPSSRRAARGTRQGPARAQSGPHCVTPAAFASLGVYLP
jgi:hypothetical protein